MKKEHKGAVSRAYLLTLLQIPMFQNYLMANVSCVRKEESSANNQEIFPVTIASDEAVEFFLAAAKAKDPSLYQELLLLDL